MMRCDVPGASVDRHAARFDIQSVYSKQIKTGGFFCVIFCFLVFFLSVFLVLARENTIFLWVRCHFLRLCLVFFSGKHYFPSVVLGFSYGLSVIKHYFSWFLLGKTLFSYGFSVISLGYVWLLLGKKLCFLVFLGKTLFSYGFCVISLGFAWFFSRGKHYFPSVVLGFRRENTI